MKIYAKNRHRKLALDQPICIRGVNKMINMTEYAKRRKALMQQIGSNGIMILPAAPELLRNGDAVYAHRQNSDFYYLTGFNEPEAVVVLAPKRKKGEYILFNRVRNPDREIWDGPRAGQKGACK